MTFDEFAIDVGVRLRVALVAAYGSQIGLDAAADAIAFGWQHWERVGAMANPAGYLYRVGQTAATRELRRSRPRHRRNVPDRPAATVSTDRGVRRSRLGGLTAAAALVAVVSVGSVILVRSGESDSVSGKVVDTNPTEGQTDPTASDSTATDHSATADSTATGGTTTIESAAAPSIDPTVTSQGEPLVDGWERLPQSPLTARSRALAVWTGTEVVVIGGDPKAWCASDFHDASSTSSASCAEPDFDSLSDGAAFDPAGGAWRAIAPAPSAMSASDSVAVAAGDVYVLIRDSSRLTDGVSSAFIRYVTAEDRWDQLPLPSSPSYAYELLAAGGALIAVHGSDERGELNDLLFDPGSDSWGELPRDPLAPSFNRVVTAIGNVIYLFAPPLVPNPGSETPSLLRVARLDLATMTWTRLADSEVLGAGRSPVAVGDTIAIAALGSADGGQVNNWGRPYPFGGLYDTLSDTWSALPEADAQATVLAVLGGGLVAATQQFDDSMTGGGLLLDVDAVQWSTIPSLTVDTRRVTGEAAVAVGSDLFVFGGESWTTGAGVTTGGLSGEVTDEGFVWRGGQ